MKSRIFLFGALIKNFSIELQSAPRLQQAAAFTAMLVLAKVKAPQPVSV